MGRLRDAINQIENVTYSAIWQKNLFFIFLRCSEVFLFERNFNLCTYVT